MKIKEFILSLEHAFTVHDVHMLMLLAGYDVEYHQVEYEVARMFDVGYFYVWSYTPFGEEIYVC